ncbi:hypothetical protein [Chrysiogenes arsenatis]|uniref:hypothetical protein n=1 Tax=Chrysiogenes arsenatis TaxID=309797 RepID=UPI000407A083|nr:hypothetical protein [Chrysiogenes arsenatis]
MLHEGQLDSNVSITNSVWQLVQVKSTGIGKKLMVETHHAQLIDYLRAAGKRTATSTVHIDPLCKIFCDI